MLVVGCCILTFRRCSCAGKMCDVKSPNLRSPMSLSVSQSWSAWEGLQHLRLSQSLSVSITAVKCEIHCDVYKV